MKKITRLSIARLTVASCGGGDEGSDVEELPDEEEAHLTELRALIDDG